MKTVSMVLFSLVMIFTGDKLQDTKTVKAIFDDYEDGTYYFTDSSDEDESYTFEKIEEDVTKSFDLTDKKYKGQTFNITYKVETEIDESEDESEMWIIVKLELVK